MSKLNRDQGALLVAKQEALLQQQSGIKENHNILGITKSYTTRVGSGPFVTELDNEIGDHFVEKGQEFGTVTKRKRRCGWFDSVLVRQSIAINGITDVVLTKLDGDSRGGSALSIRKVVDKPIKFISTGEKMDALDVFHPDRMAKRILGMGDVISLVERAQQNFDEDEASKLQKKMFQK